MLRCAAAGGDGGLETVLRGTIAGVTAMRVKCVLSTQKTRLSHFAQAVSARVTLVKRQLTVLSP